jgi:hypothetical protein
LQVDIQQAYLNLGQGVVVEQDVFNIVQRIYEYDPNLKVQFLNDANCEPGEAPYRVVEVCTDSIERPLFSVWTLDEHVLQRIYAADQQKWDVLGRLDKNNASVKAGEKRRYKEVMGEAAEITTAVLRSPKSSYTVPESVTKGEERGSAKKLITFKEGQKL